MTLPQETTKQLEKAMGALAESRKDVTQREIRLMSIVRKMVSVLAKPGTAKAEMIKAETAKAPSTVYKCKLCARRFDRVHFFARHVRATHRGRSWRRALKVQRAA